MSGRPLIGLTCGSFSSSLPRYGVNQKYVAALQEAGADVLLVPPGTSAAILDRLDGLVLPGGADVDPARYGQPVAGSEGPFEPTRDEMEIELVNAAWGRLPVLAICRGLQVVNVARGGSLVQHVEGHRQAGDRTSLSHEVVIEAGNRLAGLAGAATAGVNSLHHQVVDRLGRGLRVTARSPDGMIEGLEADEGGVTALQCHPEELTRLDWVRGLFANFVAECQTAPARAAG